MRTSQSIKKLQKHFARANITSNGLSDLSRRTHFHLCRHSTFTWDRCWYTRRVWSPYCISKIVQTELVERQFNKRPRWHSVQRQTPRTDRRQLWVQAATIYYFPNKILFNLVGISGADLLNSLILDVLLEVTAWNYLHTTIELTFAKTFRTSCTCFKQTNRYWCWFQQSACIRQLLH